MINENDLMQIGTIAKPHGLNGELVLNLLEDLFEEIDPQYLFLKLDGIFVPFFVSDYRYKTNMSLLVCFEGIDDADQARELACCEAFVERSKLEGKNEQMMSLRYFVGFDIVSEQGLLIGKIADIDDQTENWLFVLEEGLLVPAADELIVEIDDKKKRLMMNIPEGLLEL